MTSLESIKPGTPKRLTILSQIAVVLFLVWLGYAVGINHMPVKNTIWALTPPIIAISLALITKEVYSSLFLGILTGAMLNADFHPVEGLNQLFPNGIMAVLADKWNVGILVFLVILGTMVQLMNRAGGSAAFGEWASGRIKGRSGAQLSTMLLGCLIFIDDYFNCLTVGSVMRPVTDKHKISRAKLAYLIDSTAAPICIIAPISSWAAAVSGFVKGENGISIFVQSIPFNFYALLTLLMMVFLIFLKVDFGPMLLHENNARQGDLFTTGKSKQTISEGQGQDVRRVGRVSDLVIPVVFLIVGCVVGMIYTGGFFAGKSFVDAFAASDASVGLVMGSSVALVMTIAYYLMRQSLSFSECMDCLPEGFKQMVPAMLILAFAWTLKSMTDSLGAATYVGSLMANSADGLMAFLPAIIFVVAIGLAFASGTSWGTFGILIPIVVSCLQSVDLQLMIISISACMAGAVCGDHCSPISDTTIMSSAGAQCEHLNHVTTQLPYALTVASVSFLTFLVAGFTKSALISLVFGIVALFLLLIVIRHRVKNKKS
ncbi:transporter, NhaC family [Prevotella sp. ne3005]|uniref:Na+/H+ antiporter NhaC family protein n=1 Tax=Prevotella sp. ne3005 TaxID=1761887 RepID=UPI0008B6C927|nr:Na+/H+ antiporter NhaC family protein [Prevotella sp. ne3005]SEM66364.1 transporter, NhaC family [Prevotella sp. ne3005]